jgi:hypothetical protein
VPTTPLLSLPLMIFLASSMRAAEDFYNKRFRNAGVETFKQGHDFLHVSQFVRETWTACYSSRTFPPVRITGP